MGVGFYVGDVLFFFFQAEDGIRDLTVTGVQTCALPICRAMRGRSRRCWRRTPRRAGWRGRPRAPDAGRARGRAGDRKSTRLNSSHSQISYAVFCLKKKKKRNKKTLILRVM